MKGVILAGGSGTRLFPNTKVTNKHLLPVYNQPMIYYPIQTLLKAGIDEILILPGKDHAGDFAKLLGSGQDFNAQFSFKVQDHAGGLAYAVGLAENFVGDDNFVVLFGDNILEDNIIQDVQDFKSGAKIFLKQVSDPERFGIAELVGDKVINIVEKPKEPKSNWASIGVYIYDSSAFQHIKTLQPSERGELEITDLNNRYVRAGEMSAGFVRGFWFDAGTHESLVDAAYALKNHNKPLEPLRLENKELPVVAIGILLYDTPDKKYTTSRYLNHFLNSLIAQDYPKHTLYFVDNSPEEDNDNIKILTEHGLLANIIRPGRNVGFGAGHNLIIRQALVDKADFYFALNPDMILEPNVITELVNTVMKSPQIASVTGKIRRWNFQEADRSNAGKSNFIDSVGISLTKGHRFLDIGQGEIDYGQYDLSREIFGPSGAAALYRMSALDDVAFITENGLQEFFDELMFMYKEDIDLAYRLQLAGYKSLYTPNAVIYHDRTVISIGRGLFATIQGRKHKTAGVKDWSWLNHHIILQKLFAFRWTSSVFWGTIWYELKSFIYILFFERRLILQIPRLLALRGQIKRRSAQTKRRVNPAKQLQDLIID